MKKFLSLMILLCILCPLAAQQPKIKKDSFYAVFNKKFKMKDAEKASLAGDVTGKKYFFTMPENGSFDLKELCKKYIPVKDAAIGSFIVDVPADGKYSIGLSADYWITAYCNGKLIGTTEPRGEESSLTTHLNRCWYADLKKGENRIFFHTRPGFGSWRVAAGLLPDKTFWPETSRKRKLLFRKMFPEKTVVTGPFVNQVSTERASVSFHVSKPFAVTFLYWQKGKKATLKQIKPVPVYGRLPRKQIHRFILNGLLPDQEYIFECRQTDHMDHILASGSLRTFPAKGVDHTFTVTSDTQFSALNREKVVRKMVKNGSFRNTDMLIALGDVTSTFNDFEHDYLDSFLVPFRKENITVPFYPVRGNHEYRGLDTDKYTEYFGCPYYAFRHGEVLYIVIDTGEDKGVQKRKEHYTLLTDTEQYFRQQKLFLEKLADSPMCKNAKKRIVLAHATPFEWESRYYAENIASFASVFYGKNPRIPIDLWLCGDIHSPYRFDPVTKELSGAPKRRLYRGRQGRLTANDLQRIHFPVFVNDGVGGAGQDCSVTRVKVTEDALYLTCTGVNGEIMDEIMICKGKPIEVKKSIFTKYIPWKE